MTQIKKLGFGAVVTALFAALALATMASTAFAAVDTIEADAESIAVDDTTTVTVTSDSLSPVGILFTIHASSTGTATFPGGATTALVQTADDGGTQTAEIVVTGTGAGVVVVQAQETGTTSTAATAFTVTGATAGLGAVALTIPGAIANDATANGSVTVTDQDGATVGNQAVTLIAGGAGNLLVANGGSAGDACVLADAATPVEVDECVVTTSNTGATKGKASFGFIGDGAVGAEFSVIAIAGTRSASATGTVGAAAADVETVTVTAPASVPAGSTDEITVSVADEDGNPIADGTTVQLAASAGIVFGGTTTSGGVATFQYTAPSVQQTVTLIASVGSTTGSASLTVGPPAPSTGTGDGSFASAPNFGSGNVGSAVFNGGSIEDLADATADAGGTGVWVQGTDGNWYRYTVGATGATAFVNNAFNAQFEDGFAGATAVFVVK